MLQELVQQIEDDEDFVFDLYQRIKKGYPNLLEKAYVELLDSELSKEDIAKEFDNAGIDFALIVGLDDIELIRIMIKKGINLNSEEEEFKALNVACHRLHYDMVQLLLQNGAAVNVSDIDDQTPLEAVYDSIADEEYVLSVEDDDQDIDFKLTELLVSYGAKLDFDGVIDTYVLEKAMLFANVETVKLLVNEANGDLKVRYNGGCSTLHTAVHSNRRSMLEYVIEVFKRDKLDMNPQNNLDSDTPLHLASFSAQNFDSIAMLLEAGADFRIKNNERLTPFDMLLRGLPDETLAWIYYDHGFDILDCNEVLLDELWRSKSPWMWILIIELAKRKMMGAQFSHKKAKVFKWFDKLRYAEKCTEQLQIMQNTKFYENVTFWDIIIADQHKLKEYANNFDLLREFFAKKCNKSFSLYCTHTRSKLFALLPLSVQIDLATPVVCAAMKMPTMYEVMRYEVMPYMNGYDLRRQLYCCFN
ncbi:hypothetical protein TSAR_008920 [Trichomalopsis sarcophagae]|uniref:Uncharacterized protein n=1 Tax=Trichomalopsis sarcophagae TaxID=543379 RepID=A0A232F195_9HYME|nr:hypothetical protein TSAR_008920 [Trichomalopsis sarcophagae]